MAVIFHHKSKYQNIHLVDEPNKELVLYLDGHFQFGTETEKNYHQLLFSLPIAMTPDPTRVLIMGGGDGLGVREALLYPDVKKVVLAELDPVMIAMAKTGPVARLNNQSLHDPRVKIVVGDARNFLRMPHPRPFDVVVSDFPAASTDELAELYTDKFYDLLLPNLGAAGVLAIQISESEEFLDRVVNFLKRRLGYAFGMIVSYNMFEAQGFVYASRIPFKRFRTPPAAPAVARIGQQIFDEIRKGNALLLYDYQTGEMEPLGKAL